MVLTILIHTVLSERIFSVGSVRSCDLAFTALGEEGTNDGGEDSDDELYDGFPLLEVLEHSNFF